MRRAYESLALSQGNRMQNEDFTLIINELKGSFLLLPLFLSSDPFVHLVLPCSV